MNEELRLAIQWKREKVPDDLITDYKSYLKERDLLHYRTFNPNVLHALVKLTVEVFWSDERADRPRLLTTVKQYMEARGLSRRKRDYYGIYSENHPGRAEVPVKPKTRQLLNELCVKILTAPKLPVSEGRVEDVLSAANALIRFEPLNEFQIRRLIACLDDNKHIINRMLRHPAPSIQISSWVRKHYADNHYRSRRAELVAWMVNEDPDYAVPLDVLIADFEWANELDRQEFARIKGYYEDVSPLDITFPGMFSPVKEPYKESSNFLPNYGDSNWIEGASFKPRFFDRNYRLSIHGNQVKPNHQAMTQFFYSNLDVTQCVTMMWAVYYSGLPLKQKRKLLKKWYHPQARKTIFKIIAKMRDLPLLEWLTKQP